MSSLPNSSMRSTSLGARLDQLGLAARLASLRSGGMSGGGTQTLYHAPRGQPVVVRTERLVLRPLMPEDRREFCRVAALARAHLSRHMPLFEEGEDEGAAFARQLRQFEAGDQTGRDWRRLAFNAEGRLVGGFNINDIRRGLESRGELTAWVSPEFVGQGLALEAIQAVIRAAFASPVRVGVGETLPSGPVGIHHKVAADPSIRADVGTDAASKADRARAHDRELLFAAGHSAAALPAAEQGGLGLDRLVGFISPENQASIRLATRAGFERTSENELIEFLVGGRATAHEEYVLFAGPLARDKMAVARTLADLPATMRRDLRHILRVESAAALRRF